MTTRDQIETPALVVNTPLALANITRFQAHCDAAGLALRPHIKTHKLIQFAEAQIAAGAIGITCQKLSEAEVMASAGITDILITFNIVGPAKLARLRALSGQVAHLAVVADNPAVIDGLAEAFADAARELVVLIECETGARRCGVMTAAAACARAQQIAAAPGLRFGGLMTYPPKQSGDAVPRFMNEARAGLAAAGLACPVISSGGSPEMWNAARHGVITEYRIGTYIYHDRNQVLAGAADWADCAAHLLATVVSTPEPGRAVIDAGSKSLTSDRAAEPGHGHVLGRPDITITALSEEHGVLTHDPDQPLAIGTRLAIIPNHICPVSNLFDAIWLEDAHGTCRLTAVDARGGVT